MIRNLLAQADPRTLGRLRGIRFPYFKEPILKLLESRDERLVVLEELSLLETATEIITHFLHDFQDLLWGIRVQSIIKNLPSGETIIFYPS